MLQNDSLSEPRDLHLRCDYSCDGRAPADCALDEVDPLLIDTSPYVWRLRPMYVTNRTDGPVIAFCLEVVNGGSIAHETVMEQRVNADYTATRQAVSGGLSGVA